MGQRIMSWESFCDGHYNSYGIKSHPDDKNQYSDDKEVYRKTLIEYWTRSRWDQERKRNKGKESPNALDAMEELYEEFGEDSMIIINFTNRNRKNLLEDVKNEKFYDREYKWEIRGLVSVLREWEDQVKDPKQKDSLEILIQNKPELYSKPSYMVTALIHRVRRLRAGYSENPGNLVLADGILIEAKKLLHEPFNYDGINHAIFENQHLDLLIQMQIHLQDLRRQEPLENVDDLKSYTSILEDLSSNSKSHPSPGAAVYYWWALRISYQRACQNLEFKKAGDFRTRMDKARSNMNTRVKSYIDRILAGENRNRPRDEGIVEYHKALAEFMFYCDKEATKKDGDRSLRKKDGLLYRAALGDDQATGFKRLFTWHTTTKPSELIKRCRKSIIDAKRCISAISYRDHYSAHAMLMLVSIDLLIKIRWYLSGSNVYNVGGAEWGSGRAVDGKQELEIANEFRREISHALLKVQKQASRESGESGQMYTLFGNWVESLNNLELKEKENYVPEPAAKWRGPLGQLCDFCGSMVGWKWNPMRPKTNKQWDEDDTIKLHGFIQDEKHKLKIDPKIWLRISTKGTTNNPYVRRIGETASRE